MEQHPEGEEPLVKAMVHRATSFAFSIVAGIMANTAIHSEAYGASVDKGTVAIRGVAAAAFAAMAVRDALVAHDSVREAGL